MTKERVLCSIINFNGTKDTIECINSLLLSDFKNFEILVVDNNSDDKDFLKREIDKLNHNIKIIFSEKNGGFSYAVNLAAKYALKNNFDYIFILNNDVVLDKNCISNLLDAFSYSKDTMITSPKIYFYDNPSQIWYAGGSFSWVFGGNHIGYLKRDNDIEDQIKKIQYATGCAIMIKTSLFSKIGFFDERFFLYYEDTDFSLRTRKAGFKIVFTPKAKLWHKVSVSTRKLGNPIIHYYHIRNALLLSKNNANLFILSLIYIWSFSHLLKQQVKILLFPSKRESALKITKGIIDFYKNRFGKYEK